MLTVVDIEVDGCAAVIEEGSHDWEFKDDSFDHDLGTEVVHYFQCSECGATRDMQPGDNDQEFFDDNERHLG